MHNNLVIDNTNDFFLLQAHKTLNTLRAWQEHLDNSRCDDEEEQKQLEQERRDNEELITYWELVLLDNGWQK